MNRKLGRDGVSRYGYKNATSFVVNIASNKYRENYDKIFGKKEDRRDEDTERLSSESDIRSSGGEESVLESEVRGD